MKKKKKIEWTTEHCDVVQIAENYARDCAHANKPMGGIAFALFVVEALCLPPKRVVRVIDDLIHEGCLGVSGDHYTFIRSEPAEPNEPVPVYDDEKATAWAAARTGLDAVAIARGEDRCDRRGAGALHDVLLMCLAPAAGIAGALNIVSTRPPSPAELGGGRRGGDCGAHAAPLGGRVTAAPTIAWSSTIPAAGARALAMATTKAKSKAWTAAATKVQRAFYELVSSPRENVDAAEMDAVILLRLAVSVLAENGSEADRELVRKAVRAIRGEGEGTVAARYNAIAEALQSSLTVARHSDNQPLNEDERASYVVAMLQTYEPRVTTEIVKAAFVPRPQSHGNRIASQTYEIAMAIGIKGATFVGVKDAIHARKRRSRRD